MYYITIHEDIHKLLSSLLQKDGLKILHLYVQCAEPSSKPTEQLYSKQIKHLVSTCTLQELVITGDLPTAITDGIVNGVAGNKSITSFTLHVTPTELCEHGYSNEYKVVRQNNTTFAKEQSHNRSIGHSK